jgi:hypothetical protein
VPAAPETFITANRQRITQMVIDRATIGWLLD